MIPQPSKLHILGLQDANSDVNAVLLKAPVDSKVRGIANFESVTNVTYKGWAAEYGADVEPYPADTIYVGQSFDFFSQTAGGVTTKANSVQINDDRYFATYAKINLNAQGAGATNMLWLVTVAVGNVSRYNFAPGLGFDTGYFSIDKFTKQVPVVIGTTNMHTVALNISVKCELSPSGIKKWQQAAYNSIIEAYNAKLTLYNQALSEAKASGQNTLDSNPLFYRQIEQLVLRKNCIAYMMDQSKMGNDNIYSGSTLENFEITQSAVMDSYMAKARFMEQAFEWNLMSYNFYPYYWGKRTEWKNLYQFESNDAIFRSFMQAGMARVNVTVRPGFEKSVMHYMATGQIWNGGEVPLLGDPQYISIIDEIMEQEYSVKETWESVLPTNLVVLQSNGVMLPGEDGLPCSDDCKDARENFLFKKNENTLGVRDVKPEPNPAV